MPAQNFIPKIDSARALALYDDGATDGEIAAACGVSANGICRWRRRHGLLRTACNDNRLTDSQVRRAKNLLRDGATRAQVAAHIGVSTSAVQAIRRTMDPAGLRRTGLNGPSVRHAVVSDASLPRRIEAAIGLRVPKDIRTEAVNDMYLALLDGQLAIDQIEAAAPRYRSRAFGMVSFNYSGRSLDEEPDDGLSLTETLADPASLRPFEDVLERVFANDD